MLVKNSQGQKQKIYLKKTVVTGNITFESGRGVVVQGKDVQIKGEVKGATLEK